LVSLFGIRQLSRSTCSRGFISPLLLRCNAHLFRGENLARLNLLTFSAGDRALGGAWAAALACSVCF
jgi:hypothetical protein